MNVRKTHPITAMALVLILSVSAAGCAVPIILAVGAGAVGGYAASRDTFEGVTAKGQDELWDASTKVASIMGQLDDSNRNRGEILARINGATVQIAIIPINLTNTKLRIKARKGIFPRIAVAQEVYAKIMNQLE
jgi:hypothetical protein